jgi:hypothetical protein
MRIGFTVFENCILLQWSKTLLWIFYRILCLLVDYFMTLPASQVT